MNPAMPYASSVSRAKVGSANPLNTALSILLGTGFTLCLFLGIARYLRVEPEAAMPVDVDELQTVAMPVQPPPPPRVVEAENATELPDTAFAGFEASHSDSPVKIAASPPAFEAALPINLAPPPKATIRVARLEGSFRPQMDVTINHEHIFQTSEVDQIPHILYRTEPKIPSYVRDNASVLRVVMLFVVDTKGEVGNVRVVESSGNPQFDSIVCDCIKNWTFSAGIKKGKPVKCLMQQPINVKWSSGSRFST